MLSHDSVMRLGRVCVTVTEHDGPDVVAHLAVEQGLLFQTKVLRGVGHYGEGGFWIVPKSEEVMFIL